MPAPQVFDCRVCNGTAVDPDFEVAPKIECEECDGTGEIDCRCEECGDDHWRDCDDCVDGEVNPDPSAYPCRCCGVNGRHLGGTCDADGQGAVEPEKPLFPWLGAA
jgi:hypothetical protein